jgi:hypothetical protein
MNTFYDAPRPEAFDIFFNEAGEAATSQKELKTYSDTYLFNKYPDYNKQLTNAIMNDPTIDKSTSTFADVVYEVSRTRVSEAIVRILKSPNTVLLDCDDPLPKAFKVFCARDFRTNGKPLKVFIDCSSVITKNKTNMGYTVDEMKLVSYLVDAAVAMIYHRKFDAIDRRRNLVFDAAKCFAKCFTFIIDYLVKVSIQETAKAKVLYLSSLYFLEGIMGKRRAEAEDLAIKIAEISSREAEMINMLVEKNSKVAGMSSKDTNPFKNIRLFVQVLRDSLKFNAKSMAIDVVVDRWMNHYGVGTVLGMEYFPAFSAMMTDCYNGAYINHQRSIETVCKVDMINYSKGIIDLIDHTV